MLPSGSERLRLSVPSVALMPRRAFPSADPWWTGSEPTPMAPQPPPFPPPADILQTTGKGKGKGKGNGKAWAKAKARQDVRAVDEGRRAEKHNQQRGRDFYQSVGDMASSYAEVSFVEAPQLDEDG